MRSLLELAENFGKGPLQVKVIAENQGISTKYLEQLMVMLKSAGLVRSIRGSKGGYVLAKNPGEIRLSECFAVLEGDFIAADCFEKGVVCSRSADCVMKEVWKELQDAVNNVLNSKNLQDLVEMEKRSKNISYQI